MCQTIRNDQRAGKQKKEKETPPKASNQPNSDFLPSYWINPNSEWLESCFEIGQEMIRNKAEMVPPLNIINVKGVFRRLN